jgi:hypothetical protein
MVFDLAKQELSAQGELGNERVGVVFQPLADGRFLITKEDEYLERGSIKLLDSELQLIQSIHVDGTPWEREFRLSPLRRWLVFHHGRDGEGVVRDTDTLQPAKSPHLPSECRVPGDEGCLVHRESRSGGSRRQVVYYLALGRDPQRLFTGEKNWMVTAEFVGNSYVLISEKEHWIVTASGQRLYSVRIPSGVWYVQSTPDGARFVTDSAYHTPGNALLHGLDWNRPYNRQDLRVYETRSGKVILHVSFDPRPHRVKVALSPSGRFLAILRDGKLEVFELPASSLRPRHVQNARRQ